MVENELLPEELEFSYDEGLFSAERREAAKETGFIGQPRAVEALRMGMGIKSRNYNIFLSGDPGSGRHQAVRHVASTLPPPETASMHDIAFAYNFLRPQAPLTLALPGGKGAGFAKTMDSIAVLLEENKAEEALEAIETALQDPPNPQVERFLRTVETGLGSGALGPGDGNKLRVNLVSDKSLASSRPLVFESHPTQANLFGQVRDRGGLLHMSLSPGSAIDATDGFLVIDAEQLLAQAGLWDNLKKFLDFGAVLINRGSAASGLFVIKPTPVEAPVKVVLIGTDATYDRLCEADESFLDLFKISAEFDFSMPASKKNIVSVAGYVDRTVEKEGLLPVSDRGLARLLFYSSSYVELRGELTTKLSFLGDLVREADYWARAEGAVLITEREIDLAMEKREYLGGLTETKINEEIKSGEMIISLSGAKTGVINGLAVMDRGSAAFGTPTVISVSVAPGTEGIVNIEHEAGLSGEIHDKGLLIMEGYLRKHYARNFPLSMYAGICFEQSYAEVDGDSASSAELFSLLSAIGDIPLRQEIAATGSVNQLGTIQPVGGINEKIAGFYKICKLTGLTGRQGVIIPRQNVSTLFLSREIIEAVRDGLFHIYAIGTIDEGMEILTNRPAGIRTTKGTFPPRTLNNIIENRLKALCGLSRPAN